MGAWATAVVWVVYGFDCPSAGELEELQAVLLSLVAQAKAFGDIPVVVSGDMNATFEGCSLFTNLARDGWGDLGNLPTCIAGTTKLGRRIDLTVANQAYAAVCRITRLIGGQGCRRTLCRSGARTGAGRRQCSITK